MSKIKKIIIADTAVSLVPEEWLKYPIIKRYHEKYNRLPLLNGSDHQHYLKGIPLHQRKDRPDILHFGLLTAIGYAQIIPEVEIYFTLGDELFYLKRDTKLPRDQKRFYGIIENILSGKSSGDKILKVKQKFETESNVIFSKNGDNETIDFTSDNYIFGGKPRGQVARFSSNDKFIKLTDEPLELWTAISMVTNKLFPN